MPKEELGAVQEEMRMQREEICKLRKENDALKVDVKNLDNALDNLDQYGRKDSLILGGNGFPEAPPDVFESPEETRAVAKRVIEDKLGVQLSGQITACHRLRNKKRVIVKFLDHDDRNAVHDAKFRQTGDYRQRITVHENLSPRRAKQVQALGDLWSDKLIGSYHTKNGKILARCSKDQRYVEISHDMSKDDIVQATREAPLKTEHHEQYGREYHGRNREQLGRSQTLSNIPTGLVNNRLTDLAEYVAPVTRRGERERRREEARGQDQQ